MPQLSIYQVDAFTDRLFAGNPAAVVPLEDWLADGTLQAIAAENNLSETAFFVPQGDDYALRWFTPRIEVPLCGHATLATARVILDRLQPTRDTVGFHTQRGPLTVARSGDWLVMDFPADPPAEEPVPEDLARALGADPEAVFQSGWKQMAVYPTEQQVRSLSPDFRALESVGHGNAIVTAPGDTCDFVSRFFAPNAGIDEDPVTGSAHTVLVPYWAHRLGKRELVARQVSARGGRLRCVHRGERVELAGQAVLYLEGRIFVT